MASAREFSSERQAIDYLRRRGDFVDERDNGWSIKLAPDTGGLQVTTKDIEAVNALQSVVEFRVIAFEGNLTSRFQTPEGAPESEKGSHSLPDASRVHRVSRPIPECGNSSVLGWPLHFMRPVAYPAEVAGVAP